MSKVDPKDVKPMHDFVLVETPIPPSETDSGLLLPQSVIEDKLRLSGTVVAAGPGRRGKRGSRIPLDVQVGDTVHLARFTGRTWDGLPRNYLLVRESDLLAVEASDES